MSAMQDSAGLFPIRTVSDITGVNSVTLRAWERRYGLIKPLRTDKGHRLYTQNDIEQIQQILDLIDEGIPISRVRAVIEQSRDTTVAAQSPDEIWEPHIEGIISAITQFDENGVERIYNEVLSLYPVDVVTRKLILPLLQKLGNRWASGEGSVAEEHFFGVYLRNKLGARFHHRQKFNNGPKIVAACLPGELHEVGLLLFALAAHERGFQIVLLGANMPIEEIPHVVHKTGADAVALSGSVGQPDNALFEQVHNLATATEVPVFIGGRTAIEYSEQFKQQHAIVAGDDLVAGLKLIRNTLSKSQ
mgnify:CR=1 FL=1